MLLALVLGGCDSALVGDGRFAEEDVARTNDETGPVVEIDSPTEGDPYAPTVTVTGTITDSAGDGADGRVDSAAYEVVGEALSGEIELASDGGFSFDFSTAGVAGDMTVRVSATDWNENTGESELGLVVPGSVAVTPDGSHDFGTVSDSLASAPVTFSIENSGDGDLTVTEVSTDSAATFSLSGADATTLAPGESTDFTVVFNPSDPGNYAATVTVATNDPLTPEVSIGVEGTGVEWGLAHTLTDAEAAIGAVAIRDMGATIAAVDFAKDVRMYNFDGTSWVPGDVLGKALEMRDIAFSPDGQTLVAAADKGFGDPSPGGIYVWDWDGSTWNEADNLDLHGGDVESVDFSSDGGRLVSAGSPGDPEVVVWEPDGATWTSAESFNDYTNIVLSVSANSDGSTIVTGGWDNEVRIWSESGETWTNANFAEHNDRVYAVDFGPSDDMIVSGGRDNTVRIWEFGGDSWQLADTLTEHSDAVRAVVVNHDGTTIASAGDDHTIRIWKWDGQDWTNSQTLVGHTDSVVTLAFSSDGETLVSGSNDGTVRVWR